MAGEQFWTEHTSKYCSWHRALPLENTVLRQLNPGHNQSESQPLSAKANLFKKNHLIICQRFGILCTQRMWQRRRLLHRTLEKQTVQFSYQYLDLMGMRFWWLILLWETQLYQWCAQHTYHWRESRFFSSRSNFEFFFSRWKLFLKTNKKGLKANAHSSDTVFHHPNSWEN